MSAPTDRLDGHAFALRRHRPEFEREAVGEHPEHQGRVRDRLGPGLPSGEGQGARGPEFEVLRVQSFERGGIRPGEDAQELPRDLLVRFLDRSHP